MGTCNQALVPEPGLAAVWAGLCSLLIKDCTAEGRAKTHRLL